MKTTTTAAVLLALAFAACKDSPEAATAPDADNPEAPEVAEADAWTEAYARFLTDYPEALTLIEEAAETNFWPDGTTQSELIRSWGDSELRRRWLQPSYRHMPSSPYGRGKLIYPNDQDKALVRTMDGIRAYVGGLAKGKEPSPALLDAMWNLGRSWPLDFPELSR